MTRQDYEAIAKVIHDNIEQVYLIRPEGVRIEGCAIQLDVLVHDLALLFDSANPRFDWDTWEAACGLTEVL